MLDACTTVLYYRQTALRHVFARLQLLEVAQSYQTRALVFSLFRSSLTLNMPLFSSNGHGNNSIAYSAMERDPSPDDNDSHAETIVNNGVETGRSSDDIHARRTQGTPASSCIEQSNKPLTTYTGPEVTAWPTAPRKLRGFSVPLFVGDMVLILIPVAFLGLYLEFFLSRR